MMRRTSQTCTCVCVATFIIIVIEHTRLRCDTPPKHTPYCDPSNNTTTLYPIFSLFPFPLPNHNCQQPNASFASMNLPLACPWKENLYDLLLGDNSFKMIIFSSLDQHKIFKKIYNYLNMKLDRVLTVLDLGCVIVLVILIKQRDALQIVPVFFLSNSL